MPLSSRTSNLPNRYKGAATAAFLLVLLVAVLPFLFSSEVPASVSVPIANAASDGGDVVNVDGSVEPRGLGTAFNLTDAVQTEASLDVQPNPVAVGDNVLFTLMVSPSPPTSNDRFGNLTLLVARPDGTAEILGPFQSEPNGRIVVNYSPGLIGSYSIQLTYGGQFFTSSNITYLGAMSPETTLVVSSDGVPVPRTEGTWIVDDDGPADFHTIQAAINAASNGDTVLVRSGNYAENVVVNKTTLLVGQAGEPRPRILGNRTVAVVKITANNVSMIGFEAINGGYGDSYGDGMLGGGIELFGVNDCIITKNNVYDNLACGISLVNSNHNLIANNTCSRNWIGVRLWSWSPQTSNNNAISNNTCSLNLRNGVEFWSYIYRTWTVNYNNMTGNLISSNGFLAQYSGIDIGKSKGDYVTGNTIISNYQGIQLDSVFNSVFFHNAFINNSVQAGMFDEEGTSVNSWDNGYPSGGNYWSNYHEVDANGDSIGDTPYVIDVDDVDHYPLMNSPGT